MEDFFFHPPSWPGFGQSSMWNSVVWSLPRAGGYQWGVVWAPLFFFSRKFKWVTVTGGYFWPVYFGGIFGSLLLLLFFFGDGPVCGCFLWPFCGGKWWQILFGLFETKTLKTLGPPVGKWFRTVWDKPRFKQWIGEPSPKVADHKSRYLEVGWWSRIKSTCVLNSLVAIAFP